MENFKPSLVCSQMQYLLLKGQGQCHSTFKTTKVMAWPMCSEQYIWKGNKWWANYFMFSSCGAT